MAQPVLKYIEPEKKQTAKITDKVMEVTKKAAEKTPSLLDSLVLLTISFWYFFFTGLAILFRSPLPKGWLQIAFYINKDRIGRKVQGKGRENNPTPLHDTPKKGRMVKIVDLETGKNFPTVG